MGSGSPRPRASALLFLGFAIGAAIGLSSCAAGDRGFDEALSRLDLLLASGEQAAARSPSLFDALYRQATTVPEWLALVKRSRVAETLGETGRGIATADRALRAFPKSEPLAEVAAWLYLRGGRPRRALDLFPSPLSLGTHAALWSEATLTLISSDKSSAPKLDQADYARLAEATGDPSWYTDAALLAMKEGDRFAASAWLRAAIKKGVQPSLDFLWDAGLTAELSSLVKKRQDPGSLLLGADAAWMNGDAALASRLWRRALALDPEASWKAEAALAVLHPPGEDSIAAARRLAARNSEDPEALRFAAALMARAGASAEARALIPAMKKARTSLPALLAVELEAGRGAEDRLAAEALRLSEVYQDDAVARAGAMRILLEHGRYEDFLVLHDESKTWASRAPDAWFYLMMAHVLRSEFAEAGIIAEKDGAAPRAGGGEQGPAGAFAQGLTEAIGQPTAAALAKFSFALKLATTPRERSTILKESGRLAATLGDEARAAAAYRAAAAADPGDAEAVVLATKKP